METPYGKVFAFGHNPKENLRRLAKALMKQLDDDAVKKIQKLQEFLPGGDVRMKSNVWVRVAFCDSGLPRVPRENQIREALYKVVRKKHLRSSLSIGYSILYVQIDDFSILFCKTFTVDSTISISTLNAKKQGCGRTNDDLHAWIVEQVSCCLVCSIFLCFQLNFCQNQKTPVDSVMVWYTRWAISLPFLSKACRIHQVLLNHAKSQRKGNSFTIPIPKTSKEKTLDCIWFCCLFILVISL